MFARNSSALAPRARISISSTGPSPRISSGLSTTRPSSYSPGRTRIRSPGLAALTASPTVVKSPRCQASTTCVGGSVLAITRPRVAGLLSRPAAASACHLRSSAGRAGTEPGCQKVSRIRDANCATALRTTGDVNASNRSSRQSAN